MSDGELLHSPLHDRHVAHGAKFGEFGGWDMPIEYATGVLKEHAAVRDSVGLFDVSHLGKAIVKGPGALEFINSCLSNDLGRIQSGQAQYTLCLDDETGGIVDDLIVYLHDAEHLLLIPNAANTAEVVRRLREVAPPEISIIDHHRDYAVIAVQGSKSDETMTGVGLPIGHDYMSFVEAAFGDVDVVVCRTGYTGERGYEIVVRADTAGALWDALLAAGEPYGVIPCGLGSRDTLRTEMGYPLHGQDISLATTPLQGAVGWAVGWSKPAFWGRDAVTAEKAAGAPRLLRGLVGLGRGIPRPHQAVFASAESDSQIGELTSGTFSPTLKKGIGMALLSREIGLDAEIAVDIRGRRELFKVVRPPFLDSSVRES